MRNLCASFLLFCLLIKNFGRIIKSESCLRAIFEICWFCFCETVFVCRELCFPANFGGFMKKILGLLCISAMAFSFMSCGDKKNAKKDVLSYYKNMASNNF